MTFDNNKKMALAKMDKSKKGSIDEPIAPLIEKLNNLPHYFTTSSCSGRTVLLQKYSAKKTDISWLFKSHDFILADEIKDALQELPDAAIWFRAEPPILHVCCRTLEHAQKLVNVARELGFKRSGIQSSDNFFHVEISSTDIFDAPIAKRGVLRVNESYLHLLVDEANKKMKRNRDKIEKFTKIINKLG